MLQVVVPICLMYLKIGGVSQPEAVGWIHRMTLFREILRHEKFETMSGEVYSTNVAAKR